MPQESRPAEKFRTTVGGQALMEGIMMRGPQKICCAVRRPDGGIDLSYEDVHTHWYNRIPLVRGVCNMVENLRSGYKYLMHSADIALTEEEQQAEQSKLEKWLDEHTGPAFQNALLTLSAFVGVVIAIVLFMFLPTFFTGLIAKVLPLGRWARVILEAVIKLALFLGYMFLCTRTKEIHRMFSYHGAEHKTIACYAVPSPLRHQLPDPGAAHQHPSVRGAALDQHGSAGGVQAGHAAPSGGHLLRGAALVGAVQLGAGPGHRGAGALAATPDHLRAG